MNTAEAIDMNLEFDRIKEGVYIQKVLLKRSLKFDGEAIV